MLNSMSINDQYNQTLNDDLRVLIVGAGIAGMTAAQMLRRQGRHPVLIERAEEANVHAGYMLALMPMVDAAIDDLGIREQYRANSVPLDRYRLHAHSGRSLREDSLASILSRFGDYRGISRVKLIDALAANDCAVAFNTTVTALRDAPTGTVATFVTAARQQELEFDLVIIADGIHSATRALMLGDRQVEIVDTKWGGWVAWAPPDADTDLGEELWGAGFFIGIYPVAGRLGVFVGGARSDTAAGPAQFVAQIRRALKTSNDRLVSALNAVVVGNDTYYWPLIDCRAPIWAMNRTVLLGDAAAGFLPTAGVGAGMAMESAWVLTRMLAHAGPEMVQPMLAAYERAQRPRVESAQDTSRRLAWYMFRQSTMLAILRDLAFRFLSVETAIKPIQRLLAEPPDPDAIAATVLRQPSRYAQAI